MKTIGVRVWRGALIFLCVLSAAAWGREVEVRPGSSQVAALSNGENGTLEFQLIRDGEQDSDVAVWYATRDGTARAGTDFIARSGYVDIPPGSKSITVAVQVPGRSGPQESRWLTLVTKATAIGLNPTFSAPVVWPAGANPTSGTEADINVDQKQDLVVVDAASNQVSVLTNTTDPAIGTPSFLTAQSFPTGLAPSGVAVADFNGDGRPDLAVPNKDADSVSVLLNQTSPGSSTAQFASATSFAVGSSPVAIVAVDINQDGRPDLGIADSGSNQVSMLINTMAAGASAPLFAISSVPVGIAPSALASADLNGDGLSDVIVANRNSGTVSVLLNFTADGVSTPSFGVNQEFAAGGYPTQILAADLNFDGRPDVAVSNPVGNIVLTLVNQAALGSPVGSFAEPQAVAMGVTPSSLLSADLNGDGRPDLATSSREGTVIILTNRTVGGIPTLHFSAPQEIAVSVGTGGVIAVDVDSDGRKDLAVTNPDSASVTVLQNKLAQPGPVLSDLKSPQYLTSFNPTRAGLVVDYNNDGLRDLVEYETGAGRVTLFTNVSSPGASQLSSIKTTVDTAISTDFAAVSDLNRDGRADLIFSDIGRKVVLWILNSTPAGSAVPSFRAPERRSFPQTILPISVADFNGDGASDLFVSQIDGAGGPDKIVVLINNTAPGATSLNLSTPQPFGSSKGARALAAADINMDGRSDIVVANSSSGSVSVLVNATAPGASSASFLTQQEFLTGSRSPMSLAIDDMNRDGKPDVAVSHLQDPVPGGAILINKTAPGSATVAFAASQTFETLGTPTVVALSDMDANGSPDMIIAENGGADLNVFLNATTPGSDAVTFSGHRNYQVGTVSSLVSADVNLDGKKDLVGAGSGAGTVVLINDQYLVVQGGAGVGTINYRWSIPEAFSISPLTSCNVDTVYESGPVTISGINAPSPITVDGGEYSINNGPYTANDGTAADGQTVRVRARSSGSYTSTSRATLNIGGVTADFVLTTRNEPPAGVSGGSSGALGLDLMLVVLSLGMLRGPRLWRPRNRY